MQRGSGIAQAPLVWPRSMKAKGFNLTGGLHTEGKRLIVTGPWNSHGISEIDASSVTEVVLNYASGFCDSDISFVSGFKNVRNVHILATVKTGFEALTSLPALETLSISPPPKVGIDFPNIPSLRHCSIQWWNGANSILDCNMLESLYISHSNEKDLKFLEKLSRLKSLTISQSTIHSLVGLEKLTMLTKLELVHLRTLSTFDQLNDCSNLEELSIHMCSKFKDVAVLSELAKLKKLTIDIRGSIPSIAKLISLPSLANIDLGGSTIVDDGDIECLLKFPSLKFVNFRNRKHYNVTRGEFYKRRWPNQAWTNQFD